MLSSEIIGEFNKLNEENVCMHGNATDVLDGYVILVFIQKEGDGFNESNVISYKSFTLKKGTKMNVLGCMI